MVTYAKISPKSGEPQRYSWGTQKKAKKKKRKPAMHFFDSTYKNSFTFASYTKTMQNGTGEVAMKSHTIIIH